MRRTRKGFARKGYSDMVLLSLGGSGLWRGHAADCCEELSHKDMKKRNTPCIRAVVALILAKSGRYNRGRTPCGRRFASDSVG